MSHWIRLLECTCFQEKENRCRVAASTSPSSGANWPKRGEVGSPNSQLGGGGWLPEFGRKNDCAARLVPPPWSTRQLESRLLPVRPCNAGKMLMQMAKQGLRRHNDSERTTGNQGRPSSALVCRGSDSDSTADLEHLARVRVKFPLLILVGIRILTNPDRERLPFSDPPQRHLPLRSESVFRLP